MVPGTIKILSDNRGIRDNEIIAEYSRKNLSSADKIRELAMLRDEGIISESEFEEKKRELLDRLIE